MFASLTPILYTDDLERSIRFYGQLLGFACGARSMGYANLTRDGLRVILSAPNAHTPWDGARFTGMLYFGLRDPKAVDALWGEIQGRAATIYPPADFAYGAREFGIRDDNGYGLAFGAPLASP